MAANLVSTGVVNEVLTGENYANWRVCVENYLQAHDLWDTVDIKFKPKTSGVESEIWKKKNVMALHAIQISCGPQKLSEINKIASAKEAWDSLAGDAREQSEGDSASSSWSEDFFVELFKIEAVIDVEEAANTLLEIMPGMDQLEIQEKGGYTALSAAALIGIQEMAECIYNKNKELIGIPTKDGMIPVVVASSKGHEAMMDYLYRVTPMDELIGDNEARGATLISNCIVGKKFDIALDMLWRHPDLAFVRDIDDKTPAFRLSQMPSAFYSKCRFSFWQRFIYSCFQVTHREIWGQAGTREIQEPNRGRTGRVNIFKEVLGQLHWLLSSLLKLLGFGFIYKRKLMNVQAVELLRCFAEHLPSVIGLEFERGLLNETIFQAVRHGIVEFITEIIGAHPDLLCCTDEHRRDIFMCAVLYRQEKIFNLLYGIKAGKGLLTSNDDLFGNNMLHLAGKLEPSSQLDHISGAALQMQRELQWFKEVKFIVNPTFKERLNMDGKGPHDLFKENHKNMMKEGQEWMKNNATSCSVVAALMVTIMFAVAFAVPGGDSDETGLPIFLKTTLFKVFIVCDAISFFSSAASATIFLGILTSRYAEKDFLESLPRKMIVGQTTLFISFVTMMVAFSTALILMLREQSLWLPILIIVCASFPILLFVISQFPLLFEIIRSTYGPSIFNRNSKPWFTK